MRATVIYGPFDIRVERVPDPGVRDLGDAVVRAYLPELLADVLAGTLDPSPVFDLTVGLSGVPEGYAAMHERRALKVVVRPGQLDAAESPVHDGAGSR